MGDYTRLLAEECRQQGHDCDTIALNDRYISEVKPDSPTQLRLPGPMPWSERIRITQQRLTEFAPDWVSLQFVPYAFNPKGLVFGLARKLQPLFQGRQSQIMFHELWIGEPANSPARHRLVGAAQRLLMLRLVRQLQPGVVHTSNDTYVKILGRDGVTAKRLPLFGNVPVEEQNGDDWLFTELREQGIDITAGNRDQFWLTGFFGALPPDWPPEPLLTMLHQAATQQGRHVVILSVGNLVSGEPLWQELSHRYSPGFTFLKLGRQAAEKVSQVLNSMDFGLATTAYNRIGKSGSAAAMFDHGLPVIVNQDEGFRTIELSQTSNEPMLYRLDQVQRLFENVVKRQPAHARLPDIAAQFIRDLQQAAAS